MDQQPPNKILVIIVARIGDTLMISPVIRALKDRYSQAHITVLAHPQRCEVLKYLPTIDTLGTITKKTAPFRGWFSGKSFDICLLYSKDTALIKYALRVSKYLYQFGDPYESDNQRIHYVKSPEVPTHAVLERLLIPSALGITTQHYRLEYQVSEEEQGWAKNWIQNHYSSRPKKLIGIQAMSFPTKPYRNWPLEYFSTLIDRLSDSFDNIGFLLLGDKACREVTHNFSTRPGINLVNSCGELTLRQSAALIAQLDLYIGVDTGPTHIAGALDIPMVAIYHCYHPGALLQPLQRPNLEVIEHKDYSGDCMRTTPLASLPVETVAQACKRLLTTTPSRSAQEP